MAVAGIKPQELADLCKAGSSIELIDVRSPVQYREVHVAFARNVPFDQLDVAALMQCRNSENNGPLYVICQKGIRSQQACEQFLNAGYSNVVSVEGGTSACVEAGVPVVHGKNVVALDRQVRIAAGSLVVVGTALSWVHPAFLGLAALIGAGLVYSGITDTCGMGMLLARMPWNRRTADDTACQAR